MISLSTESRQVLRQLTAMLPILFTHTHQPKEKECLLPGTLGGQEAERSPCHYKSLSSLMFSLKIPTDVYILYHNIAELRVRRDACVQPMAFLIIWICFLVQEAETLRAF